MRNYILLISLLSFTATTTASEDQVSLAHLQPYVAEFDYFSVNDDGSLERAGSWTDSIEIEARRIVRTVTRKPMNSETDLVRAVAADRHSLAPIHLTQRFGAGLAGFYHTQVKGEQLTQVFTPDHRTPARIESAPIPSGVVEVNLQGLFAAALPLEAKRQISVSGYKGGAKPSGETLVFEIQGQEKVTLNDKEVMAWKVYQPNSHWTYWVSKTPPYLLKVSHPSPAGGTLVSFLTRYEEPALSQLEM